MISRLLFTRYFAEVGVIRSGSGVIVTEVNSGAETRLPEFVAVIVRLTTDVVTWPKGSTGALKVIVALVPGGFGPCVTVKPFRAGAPA